MKKFAMLAAAILFAAAPLASAADKTWNGVISDAKCNGKHSKAEHGSQTDSDHDCVTKCVVGRQQVRLRVRRQDLPDRESGLRVPEGPRRPQGRAVGRDEG